MKRFGKWTSMLALTAVLAAGCGNATTEVQNPQVEEKPPVEEPIQEEVPVVYPFTAPLTGLGTEDHLQQRPVSIMVENSPAARPQSGLQYADIVYEILAEGEITRFVAIYHSEDAEVIGPVRSIRPYFVEIGDGLDAVIVHAGWSQDAMNLLSARKLNHLDAVYGDHEYYWRSDERKAPHNLYTSLEKIAEGAEDRGFREVWEPVMPVFTEADDVIAGQAVAKVTMDYLQGYQVAYEYSDEDGLYYRIMAGEPHVDKETETPLSAMNVLICRAAHTVTDSAGRREVDIFGPGEGYLLQKGQMNEVTWEYRNGMIRAYDESGQEMPLVPGKTWIQVVPQSSNVEFESDLMDEPSPSGLNSELPL
ncbi:DUF3048 domain-containing protein [Marinicrinis lubricantis]|uniref:DUF3048 domain-containing protein n=1 Tax=Marinicrinis lubricantis TaxID=2086470 RepID=A0ABW1IUN9_9BACL